MFHRIFKVLENELPAEYEDLFFKEVEMFQDFDARQVKIYTFDDLVKEVRSDFKKVKVLEGFGRFQTIVASEKK